MKKTIDYTVMRFHKTALNLTIVDFIEVEELINNKYYKQLREWGIEEDSLKGKEKLRLKLFYYFHVMHDVLKENNNERNLIFYVTSNSVKPYLDILSKYFPFIIHYSNTDFNWIVQNTGESREILESVKNTRYNFDYSKFTKRKKDLFLQKYKIQIN